MADQEYPRHIVLAGAIGCGVLLALAVYMTGQGFGIELGGLWRTDLAVVVPVSAAIAWWLIATTGFVGGYATARLMNGGVAGLSRTMWQLLAVIGVLLLAGAGLGASAPATGPTSARVLAGIVALLLGAGMAFCGAHFATRRA